jgi:ABC-type antimicrobial peptide transport system permease subunit
MIQHYFTVAWRNLSKNIGFSFINIIGLAIGMAAAAIIFLWINYEYSFDQFHINKNRIYQVWNKTNHNGEISCWGVTPQIMAKTLQKDYEEIEVTARQQWTEEYLFSIDNIKIKGKTSFVDSGFTRIFTFKFLQGDKNTCLNEPTSILLTKSFSKKLFGDLDPMGKTIQVDQQFPFKINGIIDDLPSNTQFDFECPIPFSFMAQNGFTNDFWGNNSTTTWAMVKPQVNIENLQSKIKTHRKNYDAETAGWETFLYPLHKLQLYGQFKNGIEVGGRITTVRTFTLIGFLIVLIACINFMNLSTARSEKRAKEVGIRKVAGAYKSSLIRLFLSESIIMAFLSAIIALFIIKLSLNPFNKIIGKHITVDWFNPQLLLIGLAFIILTGITAGSYPALFLSKFQPITVLKGGFKKIGSDITPRKILVVSQFVFSIMLIVSTIIIKKQIDFAQSRTRI